MNSKEKVRPTDKDTEKNEKTDLDSPDDKYKCVLILFFFLGLVHLLPWSFFTTATEFWMYKFRNTTSNETSSEFRTNLQAEYNAALKISLQVSNIAFLILSILFGHLIDIRKRKAGVICTILILFTVITAFVKIDTDSWQVGFFAMLMAITAVINGANAVFTISMYTVLAHFPHKYLASYLLGVSLSSIFTAVMQILSLTLGLSIQNSALVYFLTGVTVVFLTLSGFLLTGNNHFYVYHMTQIEETNENKVSFTEGYHLAKKIWTSIAMGGFGLLAVDVAPTALVVSEGEGNGPWNDTYFIPTITFLLKAICHFIGRALGFSVVPKISNIGWCLIAFANFVIFGPLFMLCNAQPRKHLPVLFPHDYQYIILVIFFNLSEGYLGSRGSYNIANLVKKEELKKAYHVNMLLTGLQMGLYSFVNIVSVKLL